MNNYEKEIEDLKKVIKDLREENNLLRNIEEFYYEASGYKYGGYNDIREALSLIKEYYLSSNAGKYLAQLVDDVDYENIDPIFLVNDAMKIKAEDELSLKGIDINIEIYPNYTATDVYINENDQEILKDALKEDAHIFDDLSIQSELFLKNAGFDIQATKDEILNEEKQNHIRRKRWV